jgi:hypothetical protein
MNARPLSPEIPAAAGHLQEMSPGFRFPAGLLLSQAFVRPAYMHLP